jgi:hypothetical protein
VEVAPSLDPADFDGFDSALRTMAGRKALERLPEGFSRKVLLPLARKGHGDLFVANFRGEARNYVFASSIGEPIYHWGALAEAGLEPGCPPTGQVIQYGAMCHYRACGKRLYDFGGSPGPDPDPAHPNYGVWRFKHAFGGPFVRYFGTWLRVLRPVRWRALDLLRRARARIR